MSAVVRGEFKDLKPYLVADLFCGAGGSSTGAERAVLSLKRRMTLVCVNHWPVAIETHKLNHPSARHYVEDVTVADPNKIVPEGYLDLLMASPECRFYSRARGGKPVHDQGRMNPWAVHRWLTSLEVSNLLVENVPEFIDWGPLLADGTPDPKHKGEYFQSWFFAIQKLGYRAEWRYLNAADFGDATTRTRFFLIARKDGKPVHWPEPSHSSSGAVGLLANKEHWRAAREIIDWANPGRSLIDDPRYQKRPLSEKTRRRIARGLEKFGGELAPLYINLLGIDYEGGKSGNELTPFIMGKQSSPSYRSTDSPIPTLTTEGAIALVHPTAEPFVLGQHTCSAPRSVDAPIPTIMTDGAISVISPVMVEYYGTGGCKPVSDPVPTITTKDRFGLATPTATPFIVPQFGEAGGQPPRTHDINDPLPAVTSHGAGALVNPVLVEVNHGGHDGRARSVESPLGAVTTKRGTGIVEPVISEVKGEVDPRRLVKINGELHVLDIRFRMLSNLELARAMGFTDNESTYEFVGNISEVTRQIGNAVAVNLAKALVTSILRSA